MKIVTTMVVDGEILPPRTAIDRLGEILRGKMEHLDPTETGDVAWENLSPRDREFYTLCIEHLMLHTDLIRICLEMDQ